MTVLETKLSSSYKSSPSFSLVYLLQNFKREEQNFVVQNEINNLGFLTGEANTKMSKVSGFYIYILYFKQSGCLKCYDEIKLIKMC